MDQENRSDCRQPSRDVVSLANRYKRGTGLASILSVKEQMNPSLIVGQKPQGLEGGLSLPS